MKDYGAAGGKWILWSAEFSSVGLALEWVHKVRGLIEPKGGKLVIQEIHRPGDQSVRACVWRSEMAMDRLPMEMSSGLRKYKNLLEFLDAHGLVKNEVPGKVRVVVPADYADCGADDADDKEMMR